MLQRFLWRCWLRCWRGKRWDDRPTGEGDVMRSVQDVSKICPRFFFKHFLCVCVEMEEHALR